MASTINVSAYSDALVVLGTAGIVVPIVSRLGFSPVLGYLVAGALLGPLGLGSLIGSFPVLYWFTVGDAKDVAGIAELGVVFLLFLIGLELSLHRLLTMRRLVFGLGGLQVLVTTALLAGAAAYAGSNLSEAIILGASLSLSSTAIVLELLSKQSRLKSSVGRASFAVLLFQDLAVAPILMFSRCSRRGRELGAATPWPRLQAALALAVIVVGRVVLRPLFQLVATTRSRANSSWRRALLVVLARRRDCRPGGLSMALGAFVAGLLLAETEYRKRDRSDHRAVQGPAARHFLRLRRHGHRRARIAARAGLALAAAVGPDRGQGAVDRRPGASCSAAGPVAVEMGLLLGPGGEFAFVGDRHGGGLSPDRRPMLASFALVVTTVTMALTPALSFAGRRCRLAVARGWSGAAGTDRAARRQPQARHRGRLRPRRQNGVRAPQSSTAFLISPPISDASTVTRDRRDGHDGLLRRRVG